MAESTATIMHCSPANAGKFIGHSEVVVHSGKQISESLLKRLSPQPSDLRWLLVLRDGLRQQPYLLEVDCDNGQSVLPLAYVKSSLFGRHLVSLPYLNSGGVDQLQSKNARDKLISSAARLADRLDCNYLELRHETAVVHQVLSADNRGKVHMRLQLPESEEALWGALRSKLRSQVRKGLKEAFRVKWGSSELIPIFHGIFARRMHELGTPVYGRSLFKAIFRYLPQSAEMCCVSLGQRPVAAALLVHNDDSTAVLSASTLTAFNSCNANMVMYWHLLIRAIARGSREFDFGRSTEGSGTYQFKKQWGAIPSPAVWQYYVRRGTALDMRPDNDKHRRRIEIWKRLPHWLTRCIGPMIVRGIP